MLGREKGGGESVVGRRMVVRRSCVAEGEATVRSWRRTLHGIVIGRLHHLRRMTKALWGRRVVEVRVEWSKVATWSCRNSKVSSTHVI